MSPRERYEAAVAMLRAEGLDVSEVRQPCREGTLHSAMVWAPGDPSAEAQHALLAAAIRVGASYYRHAHDAGTVTHSIGAQWVEPPACPHCTEATPCDAA